MSDQIEIETWFWNESANKTDSEEEKEVNRNVDRRNSEWEQSKTEQAISHKASQVELKQKKGKNTTFVVDMEMKVQRELK